jgi:transposase
VVEDSTVFVGIDAAKLKHAVAVAEPGRSGEVRYMGEVEASPEAMRKLLTRLAARHGRLHVCYEAGPTGYGLYRQVVALGHACTVVAPSLIPRKPGDRVKTNRRDAVALARLLRAGELTRPCGCPMKRMRRCATWFAPARPPSMICAGNARPSRRCSSSTGARVNRLGNGTLDRR